MNALSMSMLWAGSEDSFDRYCAAVMNAAGYVREEAPRASEDQSSSVPDIVTLDGDLAVISIHGILTNEDSWWNEFAGLISYNKIREAFYYAATNEAVKEILVDISSPGGKVFGILDAVQAVENTAAIKPVTFFTDSAMTSGAFWLSAPAGERYVSPVAVVGSIGVVYVHREVTKAAEEAGYSFTVFRSGKFKALGQAVEPLSDLARQTIQSQVDYTSGIFDQGISEYLGVSSEVFNKKMGQGREFIGQQAVDAGLVDGLGNFDDVVAAIHARIERSKNGGNSMSKKKLSLAAIQALAASGVNTTGMEAVDTDTPESDASTQSTDEDSMEASAGGSEGTEGVEEDKPTSAEVSAPGNEGGTQSEVVALLKEQLSEANDKLFDARVEIKELKASVASVSGLKKIVAKSINNMTVGLDGSPSEGLEEQSAESLLALHAATEERFIKKWPVGGVGSAQASTEEVKQGTQTRRDAAMNKVVCINSK